MGQPTDGGEMDAYCVSTGGCSVADEAASEASSDQTGQDAESEDTSQLLDIVRRGTSAYHGMRRGRGWRRQLLTALCTYGEDFCEKWQEVADPRIRKVGHMRVAVPCPLSHLLYPMPPGFCACACCGGCV